MMRLACAAALLISTGLFVAHADDKADKKVLPKDAPKDAPKGDDRAAGLKAATAKFEDEFGEIVKKFQAAKTPEEKRGARTEAKELAALTVGKLVTIAEANPKDDTALAAAGFGLTQLVPLGVTGADVDKLIAVVTAHHLNSPKVKDLVMLAGRMGPAGEKFLQTAAEKSADKDVKGLSLYFLGMDFAEKADDAPNEKAAAELTAKAIEYLERAVKDTPDVRVGRQTISKAAAGDILGLKTVGVGKPAPDVEGAGLDGKPVKLASYQGKVVLLDIWATWCGPCRAMIPHERELLKRLDGKPFTIVSVSADDEKETLTKFLDKEPMPWNHWWAGNESELLKLFRVKAFPTLYLIDAKGVIRKKWIGSPETDELDKAIDALVKDTPATKN